MSGYKRGLMNLILKVNIQLDLHTERLKLLQAMLHVQVRGQVVKMAIYIEQCPNRVTLYSVLSS